MVLSVKNYKAKTKKCFGQAKGKKKKIMNVAEQDLNNRLKAAVCPTLVTRFFSQVNVSRN